MQAILPMDLSANAFDSARLTGWIQQVGAQVSVDPISPLAKKEGIAIRVSSGKFGKSLDIPNSVRKIAALDMTATSSASLTVDITGKELSPDAIIGSEKKLQPYVGKSVTLTSKNFSQTLKDTELLVLFDLPDGFNQKAITDLANIIDAKVATPPVEPKLVIEGNIVKEFTAPKDGQGLDKEKFTMELQTQLATLPETAKTPTLTLLLVHTAPTHPLSELNTLGISERIGLGESEYHHSIPNRIHNVTLTTSKMHAKIIMPGETFSFNKYLGDVSAATGFKQAYVIKQGQTVLGDGGGVCQVSSTLFRALLNAGLPITERRGHAYRVGYYEQNSKPGFDATVYAPHPDLRFVNDTGSAILVNAVADPKTLYMYIELWGKSDGRTAEVINYKQWDAVPALPTVYQDDPTLPRGVTKQIDYAAPGLKTSFDYNVTYPSGERKTQTFKTTYAPWAAVYLRGI